LCVHRDWLRLAATNQGNQVVQKIVTTRTGDEAAGADDDSSEFRLAEVPVLSARRGYVGYVASLAGGLVLVWLAAVALPGAGTSDGSLRVESEPRGAEVRINGERRGETPLNLPLAPGDYGVAIGRGDRAHERRVTIFAGERVSIYQVTPAADLLQDEDNETPPRPADALGPGTLSVSSNPAGGSVAVDGVERGPAPIVVPGLSPGEHQVVVRNRGAVSRHTVVVQPGATSTVVVGAGTVSTAAGWVRVLPVPVSLQIREGGRLIGTTESDGVMLPVGEHQLVFSDEASGFWANRAVRIAPGETTSVTLEVPRAAVSINASPWADVWIDNQRVGETPLGNHVLTIGTHQVELRHPELGVRRVSMAVSLKAPNRLAVNMREP
jgi:hypothetical protein